jgi:PAS domain S-box-containing protein
MATRFTSEWPHHLRHIQRIMSGSAEGVIMIDVHQTIRWANAAALAMHGVGAAEALGRTIDEYHANFRVKFRGPHVAVSEAAIGSVASGESFRDVVIEVTPLHGDTPQWVYCVRNLVLADEDGVPTCIVLLLRSVDDARTAAGLFAAKLDGVPSPAAIMRLHDRRFLEANDDFLRLLGLDRTSLPAQSLTGAELAALCEDPDRVSAAFDNAKPMAFFPCQLPAANGERRAALLSGQPVRYQNQHCMLLMAVESLPAVPGTTDPAAEPAGLTAEAAALCGMSPTPLHALDADMRILGVSESWLDWLGYARSAVLGRRISDFMTPDAAAHFQNVTWQALWSAGSVRDFASAFVTARGETVDALVSARLALDEAGIPQLVMAAPIDVTERRLWKESFTRLFALSPVPMVIRKLDDPRILDVNEAFTAATGHSAEAVTGHSIDELGMFETKVQRQHFETALRTQDRVQNQDVRVKTAFGESLDCLLSGQRVSAFGQTCALLVLQDVSDRRRNEMQLFEAIETVMEDTSWFSRSVIEKLATVRSPPRSGGRTAEIGDLTPREREVLGLISHGLADVDIALKLGLTRSTVRNHVATLYSKIGVHSRSSAIIWARERGINFAWPTTGTGNFIRAPLDRVKGGAPSMGAKNRRA